jgi:predicted nucleotide-binding protein
MVAASAPQSFRRKKEQIVGRLRRRIKDLEAFDPLTAQERFSCPVGFAVVLSTPDDDGCKKGEMPKARARQNVVLELGYFVGGLGRGHVCALKRGEIEIPSDFGGVVYEPFDASGGWKQALARELVAAGFEIDWNEVMR